MKTKILVLAVLLFGGLLFTSCQKDDALLENKATENQYVKDNFIEDEAESTLSFNLHNYPDPFNATTTIEYRMRKFFLVLRNSSLVIRHSLLR